MPDTVTDGIASIIAALVQGQQATISAHDLRLLSRVASSSPRATLVLGGITAVLAANEAIQRIPGSEVGPIFPEFGEGPVPITPGPYPPDFPQPIAPGPVPGGPQPIEPGAPDNPSGPQPIDSGFEIPWFEQTVRFLTLEEFLVPAELETVTQYALENEARFEVSQVVTPGETAGRVDFESRKSRVITDLGSLGDMFRERLRSVLPLIGQRLGIDTRNVGNIDVQITASNDRDFFAVHTDNGPTFPTRGVSYVYFFNRDPSTFTGGELILYDNDAAAGAEGTPSRFTTIVPAQNEIVFFPSSLRHEVRPLTVPSQAFEDSRFTVNGWIHF